MAATSSGKARVITPLKRYSGEAVHFFHVTDLHFAKNSPFQRALIESLLLDAKSLLANGATPNFLVFSGDLVNNPDDPNTYGDFETSFLQPLLVGRFNQFARMRIL
jgi:predicted MPP superfamily phosphohydrolase